MRPLTAQDQPAVRTYDRPPPLDTLRDVMASAVGTWPSTTLTHHTAVSARSTARRALRRWGAAGRPDDCAAEAEVLRSWPKTLIVDPMDLAHAAATRRAREVYGDWWAWRAKRVGRAAG